jgi:hypothetical protein
MTMGDADILAAAKRAADEAILCNLRVHELTGAVTGLKLRVAALRLVLVPLRFPLGALWLSLGLSAVALCVALVAAL